MESLLTEILLDILSRLPAESVFECKLVCKKWPTLIHDSRTYFNDTHLSHQINHGNSNQVVPSLFFACQSKECCGPTFLYHGGRISDKINGNEKYSFKENLKRINHPPMHKQLYNHLAGSCNGLICIFIHHHHVLDPIYIFNPINREYVYLPELVVERSADMEYPFITNEGEVNLFGRVSCGFGYVRSTNEYKVVRIHYPNTIYRGHVEVYTLGSGCGWRVKGTIPIRLMTPNGAGVFVDGSLYWTGEKKVVAFDLADEEFRLLPYPPCMINCVRHKDPHGLVALGGKLCFYMEKLSLEIWCMKRRGNERSDPKDIWCLDFNIGFEGVEVDRDQMWFRPILLTEKEEVILLYDETVLYGYDSKMTTLRMISDKEEVEAEYFANVQVIPYINTFVSLAAIGEKSKTYAVGDTWDGDGNIGRLEGVSLLPGACTKN